MIQLYTGWFSRVELVPRILEGLQLQLDRHGLRSIAEAVDGGLPWLTGSEDAKLIRGLKSQLAHFKIG